MPPSSRNPESPARRERRRRAHHRIDSDGHAAHRSRRREEEEDEPLPPSPSKDRRRRRRSEHARSSSRRAESDYSKSASTALSSGQLAQLDKLNQKLGWGEYDGMRRPQQVDDDEETRAEYDDDREREREERERARERRRQEHDERKRRRREEEKAAAAAAAGAIQADEVAYDNSRYKRYRRTEGRVVSGQALERGSTYHSEKQTTRDDMRQRGGGGGSSDLSYDEEARRRKRKRWICIGVGLVLLVLIIAIPVGVSLSKKGGGGSSDSATGTSTSAPTNSNLNGISPSSIPASAKGGYLDPFDWYDTTDFNVTYTDATVGGLYIMGLNSTWNDDTRANDNVPALNEKWEYGTMPIRGINIGGWLSIEPFITPSLFSSYSTSDGVVDEWTLSQTLGPTNAKSTIEQHYSAWVQESTFAEIQAAGFDHVRLPFSYWAVKVYEGDPYLPMVSWRYLLRAIEWARKYGLRINLDLHGAPGSQNGWNHSGHQGVIGWLNGTDGTLNGQRTIEIHDQLSQFFTQPRYKNIIALYGLVNEPRMTSLETSTVMTWSQNAISTIQGNGYDGLVVIGDGFLGLENWQGELTGLQNVVLDAHQYVIFNNEQIIPDHHNKITFACGGWTSQAKLSMNPNTGFGPTIFGEWSQADTDCAEYLNNVGVGCRWEGTLNMIDTPGGSTSGSVLTPMCPTDNNPRCSCTGANADPSDYSDGYKQWLLYFAQAQMDSFEYGWGWFYWTWQTESATQWSYKDALANGVMPGKTYDRSWSCNQTIPAFGTSDLPESY